MNSRANPVLIWLLALLLLAGITSACLPLAQAPIPPTDTPTLTPTITNTVIWFPPTATPTRLAVTRAPTATQPPLTGLGEVLFSDDFSAKKGWSTAQGQNGSVAFGKSELTLAVSAPKASLSSFRGQTDLGDFYLEITASPSLCQGADQYGVLLRASSAQDFDRLLVTCAGQLRLERLVGGQASVVQDWLASSQIAPGEPGRYVLGVWAKGAVLRVYINGVFEFEAREPVHKRGGLGLYARSMGDTALTVSFSALSARALE